ncbi:hypothetical protein V4C53_35565 [Paraburkholderia azotifigens]|uniref:hypothetical protein n=1 Tax=Paraburkholderia azotifigens TaxID=2057004 RepID=UPI003176B608
MTAAAKIDRVVHANLLIRAIASHGRRFFYYSEGDRYARFELDARGRVWFIDDYSERRIYTHAPSYRRWKGFTHGGTLRSLVEDMRDYIIKGTQVPRWKIAIRQLGKPEDDIWGYGFDAAEAVRKAAFALPIMARDPNAPREYYVISEKHTRRDHRYVTLWCPDDKGYCFRTTKAGRYPEARVREALGYYNAGSNVAVPCDVLDPLMVMTTPADMLDGEDGPALLNTRDSWKVILANVIAEPQYKPHPLYKGAPYNAYERECRGLPKLKAAA